MRKNIVNSILNLVKMISYKNQKYNVLAIVPARSGSKELKIKI